MKKFLPILFLFAASATFAQQVFDASQLSRKYDIRVKLSGLEDNVWHGPIVVTIRKKGTNTPISTISLRKTYVTQEDDGKPMFTTVADKKNGKWSSLYVEDFDFDGHEDLAIPDGDNGGYHAVSFKIYLFDVRNGAFVLNKPFTRLAQGPYIGIPETDKRNRTLSVFSKSGCCMHCEETYSARGSTPRLIKEVSKSQYNDRTGSEYVETETKTLVRGKWRVSTKKIKVGT